MYSDSVGPGESRREYCINSAEPSSNFRSFNRPTGTLKNVSSCSRCRADPPASRSACCICFSKFRARALISTLRPLLLPCALFKILLSPVFSISCPFCPAFNGIDLKKAKNLSKTTCLIFFGPTRLPLLRFFWPEGGVNVWFRKTPDSSRYRG